MNALLLVQQEEPGDWLKWIVFAVFFGFPVVAKIVRALLVRLGLVSDAEEDPRARRRRLAEQQRRSEGEGEDLWRRLARGEVSEPPPVAAPVPVPAPRRLEQGRLEQGRTSEPGSMREEALPESSLELAGEPAPLSVLGDVSEPAEAPESSLEQALEPAPLAALGTRSAEEAAVLGSLPRARFVLRRADLGRAIVLSEILAPPVSMRA